MQNAKCKMQNVGCCARQLYKSISKPIIPVRLRIGRGTKSKAFGGGLPRKDYPL